MEPTTLRPKRVRAPHGATLLEITWSDERTLRYPHRLLRGYCPCAGCQGHEQPVRFVEHGPAELRDLEQVGNYALRLHWGDGHDSGIYSYRWLRRLGELIAEHGDALPLALPELPRVE